MMTEYSYLVSNQLEGYAGRCHKQPFAQYTNSAYPRSRDYELEAEYRL